MSAQQLAEKSPHKYDLITGREWVVYLYLLTLLTITITSTTPSTVNNPTGRTPSYTGQELVSVGIGSTENRTVLIGSDCLPRRF